MWSYDFVHHRTHDGRAFRMLNVLDEFTRESLAMRVRRKLSSADVIDVIDVLTDLFIVRGIPGYIRSDNEPEFVAAAVRQWIPAVGARTAFIEPDSPWESGYIESFNARLRDELLNGEIFYTLKEAQILVESWRRHYNAVRPHTSLLRAAGPPARPRNRQCTNIQAGPVAGGGSGGAFRGDEAQAHRDSAALERFVGVFGELGYEVIEVRAMRVTHAVGVADQEVYLNRRAGRGLGCGGYGSRWGQNDERH